MALPSIKQSIILLGGGGHASVVAEAAKAAGFVVLGYVDDADDPESPCAALGYNRLGAVKDMKGVISAHRNASFHAAAGEPSLRKQWLELVADKLLPPIVHPSAVVSPSATLEDGVFVGAQAVIQTHAKISRGVIVNTAAIVEHECVLEPYCHMAPRSVLAGNGSVGEESLIGAGATVIPSIKIGARCTIGAGAVVVNDVEDGATVAGVPAKVFVS